MLEALTPPKFTFFIRNTKCVPRLYLCVLNIGSCLWIVILTKLNFNIQLTYDISDFVSGLAIILNKFCVHGVGGA